MNAALQSIVVKSLRASVRRNSTVLRIFLLLSFFPITTVSQEKTSPQNGLNAIRGYISHAWDALTRSPSDCATIVDPKLVSESVLYFPADFSVPAAIENLQKRCKFKVQHLPVVIHQPGDIDPGRLPAQGLLYLEHSYVVPGGRFNEMYGWDSYFIIRGLIADGRIDLARGMVENFFFEIEHYGNVLNANRSYYLSRSQPPFLTSMIMAVDEAQKAAGHNDPAWLTRAYAYAVRDHDMWVQAPHLAGDTGLSRYFDRGEGPAPESIQDESGHYRKVLVFFLQHPEIASGDFIFVPKDRNAKQVIGSQYSVTVCDQNGIKAMADCDSAGTVGLAPDFYKGDRSMRESGYDISFRFGPFGAQTHRYAPVCLNSLLYKTEVDLSQMSMRLGLQADREKWQRLAEERKQQIQKYLWDAERGLFFDYNFEKQERSSYNYVTAFFPLWAGLATKEQAQSVMKNLPIFEKPGGLVMSSSDTGMQWDYPYAWAPNQLLAVEGMRRYGFADDANRVAYEFLSTVAENFRRDGTIREKYNAVSRSSDVNVTSGYRTNAVGFGWTNGVFLNLLRDLPQPFIDRLAAEQTKTGSIHRQ